MCHNEKKQHVLKEMTLWKETLLVQLLTLDFIDDDLSLVLLHR